MITLEAFVAKWTGHPVDFDGMYGAQCVDLVEQYLHDVLNFAPLAGNAIDEFGENPNHWTWVRNNPADIHQLPARGDVMIWGADRRIGTSTLGHTAIVLEADVAGFTSFDQNWPLAAAPHQVRHSYLGIVGWGVPKPLVSPAPAPPASTPPVPVPAPNPTPAPPPAQPVNPPLVSPPPFPAPGGPPMAVPAPPAVDIPEPQPVAEAGVSTSEWKVLVGYVVQAAATGTGLLVFRAFGVHLDPTLLQIVGGLEVGLTLIGTTYIASRGIRKLGTTA